MTRDDILDKNSEYYKRGIGAGLAYGVYANNQFHNDNLVYYNLQDWKNIDCIWWNLKEIWAHAKTFPVTQLPMEDFTDMMFYIEDYYADEDRSRVDNADLSYPIIAHYAKGNLVLIDGAHRLMKAKQLGIKEMNVHIINTLPELKEVIGKPFTVSGLTFKHDGVEYHD